MFSKLLILESELEFEYQIKTLNFINSSFNINDDSCLEPMCNLLYNLYISNSNILGTRIIEIFNIDNVNRDDGLLWSFTQTIFFVKILNEIDISKKKELVDFLIYGSSLANSNLVAKRVNRITNGEHVHRALSKVQSCKVNDWNQVYTWKVSLLIEQIRRDIYLQKENLINLTLSDDTLENLSQLKPLIKLIDSFD